MGCGTDTKYAFKAKTPRLGETVFLDIEPLRKGIGVEFVQGDAQRLPFKDKAFDAIYASHILEHLVDCNVFLQEARRTIDEGTLYIWTPNFSMRTSTADKTHKRVFTYFSLKEVLIRNGFEPCMRIPSWVLNFRFMPLVLGKMLGIIVVEELFAEAKKNRSS